MAKKKSARAARKTSKAKPRKVVRKASAPRGKKKPKRLKSVGKARGTATRRGKRAAPKRTGTAKSPARKAARPAARRLVGLRATPKRAAAPKAAPRPKRPRRTKQAMPPEPRTVPTAVIDVETARPPQTPPAGPPPFQARPEVAATSAPTFDAEVVAPPPAPEPPAAPQILHAGDSAPDFDLPDERGEHHRLADYRGQNVVLYFYPKDDTPGCTVEACGFRDKQANFTDADAVVLGVSPDASDSHERFVQKYGLNFPLLADTDHRVAEAYGVWVQKLRPTGPGMGIARTTFIIDGDGRIAHVFQNVKPQDHETEVLRVLETL